MADTAIREAVGVFHDERSLQSAVDALLIAGFDRSYLSMLADRRRVEAKVGHTVENVAELEDDTEVPTRAFIGSDSLTEGKGVLFGVPFYVGACAAAILVLASGGTLVAAFITAAVAGAVCMAIGIILARTVSKRRAQRLAEQLERGGLLLWVRTPSPEDERRAIEALRLNGADDVHIHDLPQPHYAQAGGVSRELSFMKSLGM
ncbi:MAG TPA: hypothetical protein VLV76_15030 [Candidatus Acidoferrum sp.]|nr:hypothetical protein [Candidatus Acidoferrum sp.]